MSADSTTQSRAVPAALLEAINDRSTALDCGEGKVREVLPDMASHGLLTLGVPFNKDGQLKQMASVISEVAQKCMSTAFGVWAQRMTIEYLAAANTEYTQTLLPDLASGRTPGITGMASAFRDMAGCGTLEITATETEDGYVLNGPIRWASNLYPDALLVTGVRTDRGQRLIVALPVSTQGVKIGKPFSLLAMDATESTYINLEGVKIGKHQVLTDDFESFLTSVRPTFMVLQTAMCVGLATTSQEQARNSLVGVNSVFRTEVEALGGRLTLVRSAMLKNAAAVGTDSGATRAELLSMRLAGAETATAAATLEAKTAGGKGYAKNSGASRRFREAAFLPVQSPSEAQLRWELASCS